MQSTKKPGASRAFAVTSRWRRSMRGRRGELGSKAFERLERLLGEIRIQGRDLLRIGDEGLVGRLGVLGLNLEHLVQRLHAREFLDVRLGVLERLLGVVAI